jgi:hypothetical protein
MVTVWRLKDDHGSPVHCIVSERDGRWQLSVHRGRAMIFSERCQSDDSALEKATEIWRVLIEDGWTERTH